MHQRYSTPEAHRLHVDVTASSDDLAVVRLHGEADLHTAPILRDALDDAMRTGAALLVVDLAGVTFVDSMMLGVLLGAARRSALHNAEIRIVVDDPQIRRIFELTLLDRVLQLYPTYELALARES